MSLLKCLFLCVLMCRWSGLCEQHTLLSTMMSTKRLDNFEVACEWDSCDFKGHTMEELSDHMSLHLKDYLGDNDSLEELGE